VILVRTVFQARQGKITQLVEWMKQATHDTPQRPMILTDLSGPMNTLVLEARYASLAAYEQWRAAFFQSQAFQEGETPMAAMVESGANAFYTIEQE
jgi:hypothetical protein